MELPPPSGAGPESTGIEHEQLDLFWVAPYELRGDEQHQEPQRTLFQRHELRPRPDPLHTNAHHIGRGERLDGVCLRKPGRRP
jgi:hypothetical protein